MRARARGMGGGGICLIRYEREAKSTIGTWMERTNKDGGGGVANDHLGRTDTKACIIFSIYRLDFHTNHSVVPRLRAIPLVLLRPAEWHRHLLLLLALPSCPLECSYNALKERWHGRGWRCIFLRSFGPRFGERHPLQIHVQELVLCPRHCNRHPHVTWFQNIRNVFNIILVVVVVVVVVVAVCHPHVTLTVY